MICGGVLGNLFVSQIIYTNAIMIVLAKLIQIVFKNSTADNCFCFDIRYSLLCNSLCFSSFIEGVKEDKVSWEAFCECLCRYGLDERKIYPTR